MLTRLRASLSSILQAKHIHRTVGKALQMKHHFVVEHARSKHINAISGRLKRVLVLLRRSDGDFWENQKALENKLQLNSLVNVYMSKQSWLFSTVWLCDTGAGSAWGYFIVNTTFAHMCADAIVLVFATMPMTVGWLGERLLHRCSILHITTW